MTWVINSDQAGMVWYHGLHCQFWSKRTSVLCTILSSRISKSLPVVQGTKFPLFAKSATKVKNCAGHTWTKIDLIHRRFTEVFKEFIVPQNRTKLQKFMGMAASAMSRVKARKDSQPQRRLRLRVPASAWARPQLPASAWARAQAPGLSVVSGSGSRPQHGFGLLALGSRPRPPGLISRPWRGLGLGLPASEWVQARLPALGSRPRTPGFSVGLDSGSQPQRGLGLGLPASAWARARAPSLSMGSGSAPSLGLPALGSQPQRGLGLPASGSWPWAPCLGADSGSQPQTPSLGTGSGSRSRAPGLSASSDSRPQAPGLGLAGSGFRPQ
eukprot:g46823.t1